MVHQYKNNGYNIVLDVNSGCVHVVDDVVYDIIEKFNEYINENRDSYCKEINKSEENETNSDKVEDIEKKVTIW